MNTSKFILDYIYKVKRLSQMIHFLFNCKPRDNKRYRLIGILLSNTKGQLKRDFRLTSVDPFFDRVAVVHKHYHLIFN